MRCFYGYVRKITVKSRFENVNIVVVRKISSWESFKQSNGPWEGVRAELLFHNGMRRT